MIDNLTFDKIDGQLPIVYDSATLVIKSSPGLLSKLFNFCTFNTISQIVLFPICWIIKYQYNDSKCY